MSVSEFNGYIGQIRHGRVGGHPDTSRLEAAELGLHRPFAHSRKITPAFHWMSAWVAVYAAMTIEVVCRQHIFETKKLVSKYQMIIDFIRIDRGEYLLAKATPP